MNRHRCRCRLCAARSRAWLSYGRVCVCAVRARCDYLTCASILVCLRTCVRKVFTSTHVVDERVHTHTHRHRINTLGSRARTGDDNTATTAARVPGLLNMHNLRKPDRIRIRAEHQRLECVQRRALSRTPIHPFTNPPVAYCTFDPTTRPPRPAPVWSLSVNKCNSRRKI